MSHRLQVALLNSSDTFLSESAPCSIAPGTSPKHVITLAEHLLCAGPGETLGCSQQQDQQLHTRKLAASLRDGRGRENFMVRQGPGACGQQDGVWGLQRRRRVSAGLWEAPGRAG